MKIETLNEVLCSCLGITNVKETIVYIAPEICDCARRVYRDSTAASNFQSTTSPRKLDSQRRRKTASRPKSTGIESPVPAITDWSQGPKRIRQPGLQGGHEAVTGFSAVAQPAFHSRIVPQTAVSLSISLLLGSNLSQMLLFSSKEVGG